MEIGDRKKNFIIFFLLFITNPIIYSGATTISGHQPDAVAYMTLGENILNNGKLYLEGWGHVDSGLILPPLYPFLIALVGSVDSMFASVLVSNLVSVLAIIPLFLFTKKITNTLIAFITVLAIQFNYLYLYYGTAILTEATFIFLLGVGLRCIQCFINAPNIRNSMILGSLAGLLFLTRHIGIFYIITTIIFIVYLYWLKWKVKLKTNVLFVVLGFLILVMPYSVVLYKQTTQFPFSQHFRIDQYKVELDQYESSSQEEFISYSDLKDFRREARRLLPDASEMYSHVIIPIEKKKLWINITISDFFNNIIKNISYLSYSLGNGFIILFVISMLTSVFVKINTNIDILRKIIPFYITSYFALVSVFTGLIDRYIEVLYPFVLIHTISETFLVSKLLTQRINTNKFSIISGHLLLLVSLYLLIPHWFYAANYYPIAKKSDAFLYPCKKLVPDLSPMFALHPGNAFIFSANYRVLPNDSFDKVAAYAEKTNVRWLFLGSSNADQGERELYSHSDWLKQGIGFEKQYQNLVELRCLYQQPNGKKTEALYEFIPQQS